MNDETPINRGDGGDTSWREMRRYQVSVLSVLSVLLSSH